MLEVTDLHTYYGHIQALKGISFEVRDGEITTLIGANGAGKSTTIKTICGLLHPRQGEIKLDGQPIHRLPANKWQPSCPRNAPPAAPSRRSRGARPERRRSLDRAVEDLTTCRDLPQIARSPGNPEA